MTYLVDRDISNVVVSVLAWQAIGSVDVSLSLCNTQARAVNLIHAALCDDEGVTQARGC